MNFVKILLFFGVFIYFIVDLFFLSFGKIPDFKINSYFFFCKNMSSLNSLYITHMNSKSILVFFIIITYKK